ncbi:MAG: T9SS type A sorting domain-containing protein [Crocinitomicaceae bacterium]|nr:T9SS type A sorting domain-containing protein [Crocinitomicaceae bacterium]
MKQLITVALMFITGIYAFNQTPQADWVHQYGRSVEGIHIDAVGNIFSVGRFTQTTFGSIPLNYQTGGNCFLYKSDAAGNVLWAKQYAQTSSLPINVVTDVQTDAAGNIYIYGLFSETVEFGSTTLTSSGATDLFLCKLDSNGNVIWAKKYGNSGYDIGYNGNMEVDDNGNVYIGARFQVSITIGSTTYNSAGAEDLIFMKINTAGNVVWSKKFGGIGKDENHGIAIDASGNSYYVGSFANTVAFGSTSLTATGSSDFYIVKLGPTGDVIWAKKMNSTGSGTGIGIELTDDGIVYVSGTFMGTLSFGGFSVSSSSSSNIDAVFSKLDTNGNVLWLKKVGSTVNAYNSCLAVKPDGNIVLSGEFTGTSVAGSSAGSFDVYISEYTPAGSFVWAKKFGSTGGDLNRSLAVGPDNAIYVGGSFTGTVSFDSYTLTETSNDEAYLVRLSNCDPTTHTITETACGSFQLNNETYTTSGTYTQVLENAAGCDSTITLNLTINQPTSASIAVTECQSYTWPLNNQTYTASGAYTHVIPNAANCDSTITLNLTINQPTSSTSTQTACGSYTLNGQTYTNSGTYTQVIPNANNCDSTITLNLTINDVNTTVTASGIVLTATQSGATYQWINCDNNDAPIAGATAQSFTPTQNGNYAVTITANGCTETSDCIPVNSVGIETIEQNDWSVYPNPGSGVFTVSPAQVFNDVLIEVYSSLGQLVYESTHSGKEIIINLNEQPNGVYILNINKQPFRVVKF